MPWDPFSALPSLRRWLWLAFAIAACAIQGPDFVADLRPSVNEGVDFVQDWLSARNYWTGLPIYTNHQTALPRHFDLGRHDDGHGGTEVEFDVRVNAHPPSSVLMVLPFGLLDYPTATLVWNILSLAALAASLHLLSRQLDIRFSWGSLFPIVTLLLVCSPFRQQMSQGQWNLVLLLLLTLTWVCSRSERDVWAGASLALATAIKIFPGFLFLYFIAFGKWKIVISGCVVLIVTSLITALVIGPQTYLVFVRDVMPMGQEFYSDWINASAVGLFQKLFDPTDAHFHTISLWPNPWVAKVAGAAACLILTIAWARAMVLARSIDQPDVAYGLSITTMLMVSPVAWDHYFLLLIVPLAVLWVRLPPHPWTRLSFLAIVIVLCLPPVVMWNAIIPGGHPDGTAWPLHTLTVNSYGLYGLIALFVLSCLMLTHRVDPAGKRTSRHA